MTPDRAVRVRVQAHGTTVTVETVDDNAGLPGRFYVAELPIRTSLGPTTVVALDSNGAIIASIASGEISPHTPNGPARSG